MPITSGWPSLQPGETFCTVPATVALGAGWQAALGELTKHRRLARRPHADNERLTVIYNDYMNTLMGDPTTARLLPLVDAAADAGVEAFCIDAGWYDDTMQGFAGWWDYVGEWQPSTVRFPNGIIGGARPDTGTRACPRALVGARSCRCAQPDGGSAARRRLLLPARTPSGRSRALSPGPAPSGRSGPPGRHRGPLGRRPGCRLLQVRLQHQPWPGHRRGRHECRCGPAGAQPSSAGLVGRTARPAPERDY